MDDYQVKHRYNMILGWDIMFKLKIDLYFSDNKIRGNIGGYEGCVAPMKYISKLISTCHLIGLTKKFQNEEIWKGKLVLDATERTCCILDYQTKIMTYAS